MIVQGLINEIKDKTYNIENDSVIEVYMSERIFSQHFDFPCMCDQASGIKVSDVTYQDMHGTSATEVAINFNCSPSNPCTGLRLEDIKLTYNNQIPQASCKNAQGTASGLVQPPSCLAQANPIILV